MGQNDGKTLFGDPERLKAEKLRVNKATEEARQKRTLEMRTRRMQRPRHQSLRIVNRALKPRAPEEEPEFASLPPRNTESKFAQSHNTSSREPPCSPPVSPLGKLEQTVLRMGEAAAAAAFTAPVFCHEALEDIQFWASELGP